MKQTLENSRKICRLGRLGECVGLYVINMHCKPSVCLYTYMHILLCPFVCSLSSRSKRSLNSEFHMYIVWWYRAEAESDSTRRPPHNPMAESYHCLVRITVWAVRKIFPESHSRRRRPKTIQHTHSPIPTIIYHP